MMQRDPTPDFAYDMTVGGGSLDAAGLPARVAIFAQRDRVREEMAQDLAGAGLRTVDGGMLANLIDGPITLLGDIVLVDCRYVDAATLAALVRMDMRVARAGAHLVVSTSMEALDDVFAALDQSHPQILIEPRRAEVVIAVGRILAELSDSRAGSRVREMSQQDRLDLLQLSRQVEAIAHRLEGLTESGAGSSRYSSGLDGEARLSAVPQTNDRTTALPDPTQVRQLIAARHARAKFFEGELFADPAWDMLLDLVAAEGERQNVSVTSLCIAAGVPATTALRWLKQMVDNGLFMRIADPSDRRRAFIALSDTAREAMARYFDEVDAPLAKAA